MYTRTALQARRTHSDPRQWSYQCSVYSHLWCWIRLDCCVLLICFQYTDTQSENSNIRNFQPKDNTRDSKRGRYSICRLRCRVQCTMVDTVQSESSRHSESQASFHDWLVKGWKIWHRSATISPPGYCEGQRPVGILIIVRDYTPLYIRKFSWRGKYQLSQLRCRVQPFTVNHYQSEYLPEFGIECSGLLEDPQSVEDTALTDTPIESNLLQWSKSSRNADHSWGLKALIY